MVSTYLVCIGITSAVHVDTNYIMYLCTLVELCLKSTYFQFAKSFYEQIEGVAMGSPLSPTVAKLFTEILEVWAPETSSWKPKMWRRYVDDIFVIWPYGDQQLEEFHCHLNELNPSNQFTIEMRKKVELPSLMCNSRIRAQRSTPQSAARHTWTDTSTLTPTT